MTARRISEDDNDLHMQLICRFSPNPLTFVFVGPINAQDWSDTRGPKQITALIYAMRFTRQILAVAVLGLYVAQVLGGRPMHLWQSSAGNGTCCRDVHCQVSSNHSRHHHRHPHGHHHHHGRDAVDEQQPHGHSPIGSDEQHEPSTCWVCQVLGQAQDKPIELGATISLTVSAATVVDLPDFYPAASRTGFHSRAPPAVQA